MDKNILKGIVPLEEKLDPFALGQHPDYLLDEEPLIESYLCLLEDQIKKLSDSDH